MKRPSVLRGTLILTLSGVICRIIGFLVRVLLVRIVGPEGIGLFTRVSALYMLVLSLASAGIPVAVVRLVATSLEKGKPGEPFAILRTALAVTVITGLISSLGFGLCAPFTSDLILRDSRTYPLIICLAPELFIVAISSVIRGFLQGYQWMEPIALSQFIERVSSGVVTLWLSGLLLARGVAYGALGIVIGSVTGELAGFLVVLGALLWMLGRQPPGFQAGRRGAWRVTGRESYGAIGREILSAALPVTALRVAASAVQAVSAIIIPARLLLASLDVREATVLYGNYTGIALPVIFFPTILTFSLSSALTPALSQAMASGRLDVARERIVRALRLTLFVGFSAAGGCIALSLPLCEGVFHVPEASPILVALALSSIFIYLRTASSGMMNGLGLIREALMNFTFANVLGLTLTYWLVPNPRLNIYGAVVGLTFANALDLVLNLRDVRRATGLRIRWQGLSLVPFITGLICGVGAWGLYSLCTGLGVVFPLSLALALGFCLMFCGIALFSSGLLRFHHGFWS